MHNSRHKQCPRQLTDFVEGHNVTALDVLIGRFSAEMILYQTVNRNNDSPAVIGPTDTDIRVFTVGSYYCRF